MRNYFSTLQNQKQRTRRSCFWLWNIMQDGTDEIFYFLLTISDSVQKEFDQLVGGDSDKKRFVKALSRIFALLLNTKVDTAKKIKRIIKIAI